MKKHRQKYDVDYSQNKTPSFYRCSKCGAQNCKLWYLKLDDYKTRKKLMCAICSAKEQSIDIENIDAKGRYISPSGHIVDTIKLRLPAVLQANGDIYLYNSQIIPLEACQWWHKLSTLPQK